jgi:exodeoxyribonuclease VII small subunit
VTKPTPTPTTFEDAQRELERILAELEGGRASLEDAIALWERGDELYRYCLTKLDSAEGKIEELGQRVDEARP